MSRRRFVHRDDATKWVHIFLEGTELVVISGRGNFRQKSTPVGSVEGECKKTIGRGYLEVDEAGTPLVIAPTQGPSLEQLTRRVEADPYGGFFEAKAALLDAPEKKAVIALLLRALAAIEADVDEHDTQNYNSYFPPTDVEEPGYGALHAYREHYQRLAKSPTHDADWAFHVSVD